MAKENIDDKLYRELCSEEITSYIESFGDYTIGQILLSILTVVGGGNKRLFEISDKELYELIIKTKKRESNE